MAEFEFSVRQGCARGWPNHCARSQRSNLARIQKVPGSNLGQDTELLGDQASKLQVLGGLETLYATRSKA
jgi:hypothetical protein